jgi:hypothetical protein
MCHPTTSYHYPPPPYPTVCPKSSPSSSVSQFQPSPLPCLTIHKPITLLPPPPHPHHWTIFLCHTLPHFLMMHKNWAPAVHFWVFNPKTLPHLVFANAPPHNCCYLVSTILPPSQITPTNIPNGMCTTELLLLSFQLSLKPPSPPHICKCTAPWLSFPNIHHPTNLLHHPLHHPIHLFLLVHLKSSSVSTFLCLSVLISSFFFLVMLLLSHIGSPISYILSTLCQYCVGNIQN